MTPFNLSRPDPVKFTKSPKSADLCLQKKIIAMGFLI
jgi:hypothetical protein